MTTASTNTTVAQDTNAHFDAWINEIYTNLVTNCGLTQTADTGQLAAPTAVAIPGAVNTSAGYYIFRFNDTLQGTSPVFIKMEFGTGGSVNAPDAWITVGTGSNGTGTITGTVMTRVSIFGPNVPASLITNYPSRYCYNATQGFLGMAFKLGSNGSVPTNGCLGGFVLYRSVNSAGNTTGDSLMLLTNSSSASPTNGSGGVMQVISYNLSAAYMNSGPLTGSSNWMAIPFSSGSTLEGTAGQIFPVFQWNGSSSVPGYGITNACAMGILAEEPLNSTVTVTVLGSVSLTYISVGVIYATNAYTNIGYSANTYTFLMLWQ